MPSPIRVPIHHKLLANSDATAVQEDVDDAISAYLTPLLAKHDLGQPLIYENLLESYEAAKRAVAASSGNTKARQKVEHLHESQLVAYEACARKELSELAQTRPTYPSIEDGESMPAYIERFVQTVHEDGKNQSFKGWRVSEELMDEVFWSKIKAGARRAYFTLKGQSIANTSGAKDEEGKGAETRKINAFEAAALGALVSKSESQDSEMAEEEENDMARDDEGDDDDCGEEEDGENDDAEEEDGDDDDDDDDDDNGEGGDDEDADTEDAEVAAGNDVIPANSTVQSKKRRRLPNGPLGGGGNGNAEGGRKQHPAKKPKTGNGASGGTNGGGPGRGIAGGRGKGGTKNGKAGRGAGGGRGNRKRNRKKGTGAGAGGIA